MNGAVEMERDRECRLLLNDLNDILSEQCLEQRVRCRYLNDPVQELAECINQLLDICERAVTMTLDIENDYRTMRAELQSNIRKAPGVSSNYRNGSGGYREYIKITDN